MDHRQARAFIKEISKYGSVYGLQSIRSLMARLGDVQEQLSIIHVAGTNGKGSVCAMLSAILQAAGYRTGVYSSPAVFEPEEIMKVNGICISQEVFAELATKVQAACMDMRKEGLPHPTAFEVETAIAFCFFLKKGCDLVVLETGLGGAEDATNLITHPMCSVLTSISMDHMAVLGNTLEQIAEAKAGILKPGCPCVTSEQKPQVFHVLRQAAEKKGCKLRVADSSCIRSLSYDGEKSWFEVSGALAGLDGRSDGFCGTLALAGACQRENLACVLETIHLLQEDGVSVTQEAVRQGLANVRLPGRLELICKAPDFYIDGAHNEGAALCLRETVRHCFAKRRVVYIVGVLADKEYEKVLKIMLPYAVQVFTITPDNPRALDGRELARQAQELHPAVSYVPDIAQAAVLAKNAAGPGGVVLAFGSFSYLGELKRAVAERKTE